ncbi:hypothetical protein ACN28C_06120 [Plantactinospora sp. WMMC1484]|uniref:hypothetical protein n=1 Tax=Plantactinospora sp. WMMC1484 TaxID=3404122 RepID=UPI003BF5A893
MTEPDRTGDLDRLFPDLHLAFTPFRSGEPLVVSAGAEAARTVVARRRRNRTVTTAALAALIVAVPAVVWAAALPDRHVPPPAVEQTTAPAPSPSTTTPAAPPTPGTPTPGAPQLPIGAEELRDSVIDVPRWSRPELRSTCPSGPIRFDDGQASGGSVDIRLRLTHLVELDLDGDGVREAAVRLACEGPERDAAVALAFDRDRAGRIVRLGIVLEQGGDVAGFDELRTAGSAVEVRVRDYHLEGLPSETIRYQWRAYSWNGERFVQSGGPTAFPPHPLVTDLSIGGEELRLTRGEDGAYTGTLSLTVRNAGPQRATAPELVVTLPPETRATGTGLRCTAYAGKLSCVRTLAPLDAGRSVDLIFEVRTVVQEEQLDLDRSRDYSASIGWSPYPESGNGYEDNTVRRRIVLG